MHILLVEDERQTADYLRRGLTDAAPDLSSLGTVLEGGILVQIFDTGEGLTPLGPFVVFDSGKTSHMRTITIAELKAHLRAELKKVQAGDPVTVLDHKRPVAVLGPVEPEAPGLTYVRRAVRRPEAQRWAPLTDPGYKGTWEDVEKSLDEERADRF